MDIDEVFDAKPISIERLLREPGQCFYIPAYQRPYSWDSSHITRLFDDTAHGVSELLKSAEAITFLGTIITIHDTEYSTVDPKVIDELPARVMTVIDGQQRLTTLLLLIAALHDELTTRQSKLSRSSEEADQWLANKAKETFSVLGKTLEDDRDFGDLQYYPRIARAYQDKWSRWKKDFEYNSPIAGFLFQYGQHMRTDLTKRYKHTGDPVMKSRFNLMKRLLNDSIAQTNDSEEAQFPSTSELVQSQHLTQTIFQGNIPDAVRISLMQDESSPYAELFRVLAFSRFVLQRVAVTIVIAKSEEYAFDMFEALNTTGEPLTAIETFKPRIIQAEGHSKYEESFSFKAMEDIERYLDRFTTAPARQTATADLLIPFALAESGEKLSKRLNDQRRYLLTKYEAYGEVLDDRHAFLRHLARTTHVVNKAWKPESGVPELPGLVLGTEARLCIAVLRAANHHIILGPLTRFYSLARSGDLPSEEIETALKAMTAFFGLWRGAFETTANIDSRYRTLMADGNKKAGVRPFARSLVQNDDVSQVNSEALCTYMLYALDDAGIGTKEKWVARASDASVYKANQALTRLLLLAATHDTVPDDKGLGLTKAGSDGVLALLTHEMWTDERMVSVEHIAPQHRTDDWDSRLYESEKTIHRLGNLMLIPREENSAISNSSWNVKRACFKILSAQSPDEAEDALSDAVSNGIDIPQLIASADLSSSYRPLSSGVAQYRGDWGTEIVESRSNRLAELAWDRLAPWVGLS